MMMKFQIYQKQLLFVTTVSLFTFAFILLERHLHLYSHVTAYLENKISSKVEKYRKLPHLNVTDTSKLLTLPRPKMSNNSSSATERAMPSYGNLIKHGPPETNLKDKYIIYRCRYLCGGLADRQKGIVTSYVLSQMLRRKFGLIMKTGCDFSEYVIPNEVDWNVNMDLLEGKSTVFKQNIDTLKLGIQMRYSNLEMMFDEDVTFYQGNVDFVPFLMNKPAFQSVSWARNKSHYDIYRIAFAHLFKFAPPTQRRYGDFHAQTQSSSLVCAHLRMGKSKTLPSDVDFLHKKPDPSTLIQFLKKKLTKSSKLFIATDSDEVREQFKDAFSDHFIEMGGIIVHIERSRRGYDCSGMEKAILDQFILSTCDVLVMSSSGFSRIAAILRGTENNLYMAYLKVITKSRLLPPTDGIH